jgi:uncharacterized protein
LNSHSARQHYRFDPLFTLICACLLMPGPGCTADQLVLPANHERINPGVAQRCIVRIQHRNVEYWVMRSPGAEEREPEAFVLFFVGKGDRADRWIGAVARAWGSRPVELWGMNYPDSGGSDGPACLACVCPDALGIFDQMTKVAGPRPIFLQAGSFGTAAALCVAARRPVAGLELQNPPPLRQLIMGRYGWWNLWLLARAVAAQIPPDLDSISNAAHCTTPAIFVLSDEDEVVPPPYHDLVVNAYAGPRRVIHMPGAKHNDPLTREAAREVADDLDWLWGTAKW